MRLKAKAFLGAAVTALVASVACSCYAAPTSPTTVSAQPTPVPAQRAPLSNDLFVRMPWSLTGLVFETTSSGSGYAPVLGVTVYCDACGEFGHTWTTTDASGFYRFSGDVAGGGGVGVAPGTTTYLIVDKEGYKDPAGLPATFWGGSRPGFRELTMRGDTRFDIELVRR